MLWGGAGGGGEGGGQEEEDDEEEDDDAVGEDGEVVANYSLRKTSASTLDTMAGQSASRPRHMMHTWHSGSSRSRHLHCLGG